MLTETMTALMDKAREITGLTEKISVGRLTSLMDAFSVKNLVTDSSNDWKEIKDSWYTEIVSVPVKAGESYIFTCEVKDLTYGVALAVQLFDDQWRPIYNNTVGNLNNGNISKSYVMNTGFITSVGKRELTMKVVPANAKHASFLIPIVNLGSFSYRNPIVFQENSVGGVIKRLLNSLVPSIGGACYDA